MSRKISFSPNYLKEQLTVKCLRNSPSEMLIPQLKTGRTVILDNASFHKSENIIELIENAGCELQYLLPYSPDFNEIEYYWFPIKKRPNPYFDCYNALSYVGQLTSQPNSGCSNAFQLLVSKGCETSAIQKL